MTNRKAIFILLLTGCMVLSGCLKESTDTVLLPLPLRTIEGVAVPEGLLDHLKVHEGSNPPDIKGMYLASPLEITYATDGYWNAEYYDLYMAFEGLGIRNITSYREKQNSSRGSSSECQLIGSGDDFTAFYVEEMEDTKEDWWCKVLTIISGTKTPYGIKDFQYVNTMVEKRDPHNKLMAVGEYHILEDSDNRVEECQW